MKKNKIVLDFDNKNTYITKTETVGGISWVQVLCLRDNNYNEKVVSGQRRDSE